MSDNDRLIGEIHATVKATDLRLSEHLDDYKETKAVVYKVEKRQIAFFAWLSGSCAIAGGTIASIFKMGGS